jgi:hypothetical protein
VTVPTRGAVQRTFVDARVLAGFTDAPHFDNLVAGEYLATLDPIAKQELQAKVAAARHFVSQLQPVQLDDAVVRPITGPHVDAIVVNPVFQRVFQGRPVSFAYVRPEKLIALQVHVEPRADKVPSGEPELLHWALPQKWDVPAEISLAGPTGPIYVVTSSPVLQGLAVELEAKTGRVVLSPPPHVNLVQVAQFQNKFFLRNGYHRVFDAVSSGVAEIPALIVPVNDPREIELGGTAFGFGYVLNRPRPPLVADLCTQAAIDIQMRERRYGVAVNLDVKSFNIGI